MSRGLRAVFNNLPDVDEPVATNAIHALPVAPFEILGRRTTGGVSRHRRGALPVADIAFRFQPAHRVTERVKRSRNLFRAMGS